MSEWISVKDDLPSKPCCVLIAYKNFNKYSGQATADFYYGKFYSGSNYPVDNVTHWMELPAAPICE